ncbi:MAG: esterase-like activity of phytase family protein [Pseudomonadota bacterium]
MRSLNTLSAVFIAALTSITVFAKEPAGPTLTGWAAMPAATFADSPTSGQFAAPNPYGTNLPPYIGKQPVQGFSAVLRAPGSDTFHFLVDNGFGAQSNSADALLRMYTVKIDFRTQKGGSGTVSPADFKTGRPLEAFDAQSRITLSDPDHLIGMPIQADYANYYNVATNPAVPDAIRSSRLLTGADLDIESVRRDRRGNFWFGDEFGPYLVKTDATGRVLLSAIPLPGVYAPENRDVVRGAVMANLGGSGGFEGMAINESGSRLYTLLEKTVAGDAPKTLRIDEFDIASEAYTGVHYVYPLDAAGTNIGDMTAVDDHRFVVIERNGGTATSGTPFKKLFLIDIEGIGNGGLVTKTELVDLMNIDDPQDLNGDGSTTFTLPYVTIENVLVLNPHTLLVANDNNFPYGGGRALASDNAEFLRISLPSGRSLCKKDCAAE